nr:hypothetical protein [Paraburkholderia sp. BCC1885]
MTKTAAAAAAKDQASEAPVGAAGKPGRAKKDAVKKDVVKKDAVKKVSTKKEDPAKKETAKKATTKKDAAKKDKVVRDSFTMPKSDYDKIAALKQKCLDAGVSVKKSEVLRAGLLLLEGATSNRLLAAISAVETVKTGRPTKS